MPGADRDEVPVIECDDDICSEPLRKHSDGRIGSAEWEVAVALDERSDSLPIFGCRRLHVQPLQATKKSGFDVRAKVSSNHVADLGHDECRNYELKIETL